MNQIKRNYFLNEKTILLTGEYDSNGKLITRVIDGIETFLVNHHPLVVIEKSLLRLGSDLRGAHNSSKEILGPKLKMYPLTINYQRDIFLMPTKGSARKSCIWLALNHIRSYKKIDTKRTEVLTNYGHEILLEGRSLYFANKLQNARRLRDAVMNNVSNSSFMSFEPLKGFNVSEDSDEDRFSSIVKPK